MTSLQSIGKKHNVDKANEQHTFTGQSYLDIYEDYFGNWRDREFNLLEIGVLKGNSLKMWKEYFPKSYIYGFDIDPDCKQYEEDGIEIIIGNQKNDSDLEKILEKQDNFSLIIDDGSHVNTYTISSFNYLFPRTLNSGGWYIIEDLATSYSKLEEINVREIWTDGMALNDSENNLDNYRGDMDYFFERLLRDMDNRKGNVRTIQLWFFLAFINKI